MLPAFPEFPDGSGRILVVGPCGSALAADLRGAGHRVTELLPSDFTPCGRELADVVAVLPGCADAPRVGGVAAACSRCVWFQEQPAPPGLAELLASLGVPLFEGRDLREECIA